MENTDDYRTALATNNSGIALLNKGHAKEAIKVFREAFRHIGFSTGSPLKRDETNTEMREEDTGTGLTESFRLRILDEDDLQSNALSHMDGYCAIALRNVPSDGDDLTFSVQVASFLYNFSLAYLVYFQCIHSAPLSSSLLQRAKILLRHAKAIVFPRLASGTMTCGMCSVLLNLATLILRNLVTIYKLEKDIKSLDKLYDQQKILETFLEEATGAGVWIFSKTAKAA